MPILRDILNLTLTLFLCRRKLLFKSDRCKTRSQEMVDNHIHPAFDICCKMFTHFLHNYWTKRMTTLLNYIFQTHTWNDVSDLMLKNKKL